jgi:hypothetical protein
MPVVLRLQSYDQIYQRLKSDKILINNIDIFNTETKEMLDTIIIKNYSEDNLSIIPTCQCGELKGTYYVGDTCYKCNTKVVNGVDDAISFLLWVQKPETVEQFISPIMMQILLTRYKISRPNVPLVQYIVTPNFKIEKKQNKDNQEKLDRLDFLLKQKGIARGYNSFVRNFETIIELLEENFYKKKKKMPEPDFLQFIKDNRGNIFSDYMPFPNKRIFATESNELGRFIDKSLLVSINVIRRMTGIDRHTRSTADKQLKVAKSLIEMGKFYQDYMKGPIFKKPGLVRQQIDSARSHFTARAVIVSIAGPHKHDELHIPWSVACSLLRPFVLSQLDIRGYSYKKAIAFLIYHNAIYHPLIDEIFQSILQYSGGGLKALFNRNPSLHRGSIQTVRVTRIKTDPRDTTFGMSDRIGPAFNSDHDGDEMNLYLMLTEKMSSAAHTMEPSHNILGLTGPNELSNNIKMPKTITSTLSNWIGG